MVENSGILQPVTWMGDTPLVRQDREEEEDEQEDEQVTVINKGVQKKLISLVVTESDNWK